MCDKFIHIVKRSISSKVGIKRYLTGRPCAKGHYAERITSTGQCTQCLRDRDARIADKRKAYFDSRKAAKAEYDRRYREKNLARCKQRQDLWRSENREKWLLGARHGGASRRAICREGMSQEEYRGWINKSRKVCYWCNVKCEDEYHVDHYIPLSKGGSHVKENLVIACKSCNLRKKDKDPFSFAAQVGRLF
jgi:5-methylcytosine-specific restriction endonuclease McrA